jgi:peptide/nickel transport system permease protein
VPAAPVDPIGGVADTITLEPAPASVVVEMTRTKRLGVFGYLAAAWLSAMVLIAVLVPWLPVDDPTKPFGLKSGLVPKGPGTPGHLLGGDNIGRDLFARVVWGTRVSLAIGIASVLLGLFVGGALGLIAGFYRGRTDTILSALFNTLLAIPQIVLALTFVAVFAPSEGIHPSSASKRLLVLIIGLGIVSIPILARITRANTLAWSQREFVLAARAIGAKNRRIIIREVLPNVMPAMFSIALLGVAVVIVAEGGLAILGVGAKLPDPSWGNIIAEGYPGLRFTIWPILAPSIAIFLTVLSLNYLGDVVRARFDVRESAI